MKHYRMNKMEKSKARKELEADVTAFNKILKPVAPTMPIIHLLNNCHPLYRSQHARALKEIGEISEIEMKQYIGKVFF